MLTKSQFMCYTRCPVELWLKKYHPRLVPEIGTDTKRLFAMGNEVDELSRKLFPGGEEISGYNERGWANTQKAMSSGAKVLFQPTAISKKLSAKADILTAGKEPGTWDIREVKMSTDIKDEQIVDLAFQRICFEEAGVKIEKTYLVHINNQYVRNGDIDVNHLFLIEDVTTEVSERLDEVVQQIKDALQLLDDHRELSEILLQRCEDPHKCEFLGYCINSHPDIYSVIPKLPKEYLLAILQRGLLDASKIDQSLIKKIGYIEPEKFHEIDSAEIKKDISELKYPLYFIDYETYGPAIPPFDGFRPYQQIPFQYALYIKESPSSELKFVEFLARKFENPVPEIVAHMREHIGDVGSVIVWYQPFESARNAEMAEMMPEYKTFLLGMNERMFDLMLIFKFKRKIYTHSGFNESASLKAVLPVVCPDLSYEGLGIKEGGEASASWPVLTNEMTPELIKQKLAHDMLEYCKLDSYAMVRILEHLEERIAPDKVVQP